MLQSINFLSCDEKVSVIYHDPVFPENKLSVFDSLPSSGPSFCGKEISVQKPVDISYDDITTQYKVVFTPDQKGNWKKASFLFDFTTSMLQAQTQFFKCFYNSSAAYGVMQRLNSIVTTLLGVQMFLRSQLVTCE